MPRREITLTVGGPRTRITKEEAEEVLKRFEDDVSADDVVVTMVDLSCRQWCVEAIHVLKPLLERVGPQVAILDLDDTIAGLETSLGLEIFEVLATVFSDAQNVQEIRLSDNAMGPRALEKVAPLLSCPKLERLYLNNCGLSAETIPQLNQALQVGGEGPGVARLTTLALNKNMIGVQGAEHMGELLQHCVKMTSFSYCGCRPTFDGSKFIADGLLKLTQNNPGECALKELSLYDCTLLRNDEENEALVSLAEALQKCPNMVLLNLRDVGELGEDGTRRLAEALLESGCKLVSLDLSTCCTVTALEFVSCVCVCARFPF
jgi:Ran GTPase-activating protein (RanGAP) involved in mRNA processing and transport